MPVTNYFIYITPMQCGHVDYKYVIHIEKLKINNKYWFTSSLAPCVRDLKMEPAYFWLTKHTLSAPMRITNWTRMNSNDGNPHNTCFILLI